MTDIVKSGIQSRQEQLKAQLRSLVYDRYLLSCRIEEIDKQITRLEGAMSANELTQSDINTKITVNEVKKL